MIATFAGQVEKNNLRTGFKKAYFYKDSTGNIQLKIIEVIPDIWHLWNYRGINKEHFSGEVFIYDANYNLKNGFIVSEGKPIGRIKASTSSKKTIKKNNVSYMIQTCRWEQTSYVTMIDVYPQIVIYAYQICDTYYIPDYYYQIPSQSYNYSYSNDSSPYDDYKYSDIYGQSFPDPVLPGINDPVINNIKDYLKCFGYSYIFSKYRITVFVQEPQYGSTSSGLVNGVGHVCIGLTKDDVTQVIGFYPSGAPVSVVSNQNVRSTFRDNGTGDFNYTVSASYSVSPMDFENTLNYLNGYSPDTNTYNLYSNNCTDIAYVVCGYAGIQLPGRGTSRKSPGQLGQDLRSKADYGDTRINTRSGNAPKSKGPCP